MFTKEAESLKLHLKYNHYLLIRRVNYLGFIVLSDSKFIKVHICLRKHNRKKLINKHETEGDVSVEEFKR